MLFDAVEDACNRSRTIIRDMRDFARQRDRHQKENLCNVVDGAIRLAKTDYNLKKDFGFNSTPIEKHYQTNSLVMCDRNALTQVFFNILANGTHAMAEMAPRDRDTGFVIEIYDEADAVVVTIGDSGPGIPPHQMNRIFEPFFTTKEAGKGTGLGLSISYFIVTDGHNGKISVSSELGVGTVFTIVLPVNQEVVLNSLSPRSSF